MDLKSKNSTISTRMDDDLRARITAIHRRHKTTDATILTALLEAFCDEAERTDAVRFPITLLMAEKQLLVAEDTASYGGKKPGHKGEHGPPLKRRRRGAGPDSVIPQSA